jgi:hypothetical protein
MSERQPSSCEVNTHIVTELIAMIAPERTVLGSTPPILDPSPPCKPEGRDVDSDILHAQNNREWHPHTGRSAGRRERKERRGEEKRR